MMFRTIGVIGGGTMGQGISEMLAARGLDVMLAEKTTEKLDRAIEQITVSLDKQIERWALTEAEKKSILSKIKRADSIQDMASCELVIETISEDLNAKKHIFFQLNQICSPSYYSSNEYLYIKCNGDCCGYDASRACDWLAFFASRCEGKSC